MYATKFLLSLVAITLIAQHAHGQLVRKIGQMVTSQFAKESAEATAKSGAQQAIRSAAREAAEASVKATARSGAERSVLIGATNQTGKLIAKYGDDASEAFIKITPQNARRLSMLGDELEATGKAKEVLGMIAKGGRGDQVVEFLFRNKGTLVGSAVVATFVANPEAFLDGTGKASSAVLAALGDHVVEPVARETGQTFANWLGATVLLLATGAAIFLWRVHKGKQPNTIANVN